MIVVIEGAQGVGKTTLGKALSAELRWPLYRPFRDGDTHNPGDHDPRLKDIDLPVNTWLEDMYVADVLGSLRLNVILDRSLPSGLAYSKVATSAASDALMRRRASVWGSLFRGRAAIILLSASSHVRRERFGPLFAIDNEAGLIEGHCRASGLRICQLNTDEAEPRSVAVVAAQQIHDWEGLVCQPSRA